MAYKYIIGQAVSNIIGQVVTTLSPPNTTSTIPIKTWKPAMNKNLSVEPTALLDQLTGTLNNVISAVTSNILNLFS